jgi:hypothetical protein
LKLFSLIFGVLVVVFIEDDDDGLIRMAAEKGSFARTGKHVLDIDSRTHSDVTMKDL